MSYSEGRGPITWEEAAEHESKTVLAEYRDRVTRSYYKTTMESLDHNFEQLRAAVENGDSTWTRLQYAHVGSVALIGYVAASNKRVKDVMGDVLTTIASKQHDYGHENIAAFGSTGLVVRINDKLARLKNLKSRGVPANEPLLDTWLDIVGYCIVGRMWEAGTFSLPLAADIVHGPTTPGHPDYLPDTGMTLQEAHDAEERHEERVREIVDEQQLKNADVIADSIGRHAEHVIRKIVKEEIGKWVKLDARRDVVTKEQTGPEKDPNSAQSWDVGAQPRQGW